MLDSTSYKEGSTEHVLSRAKPHPRLGKSEISPSERFELEIHLPYGARHHEPQNIVNDVQAQRRG